MVKRILLPFVLLLAFSKTVSAQESASANASSSASYYTHSVKLLLSPLLWDVSAVYEYRPNAHWGIEAGGGWVYNEKGDAYYYLQQKYDPTVGDKSFLGTKKFSYQAQGPIERIGLKYYPKGDGSYWGIVGYAEQAAQGGTVGFYEPSSSMAGGGTQYWQTNNKFKVYSLGIVKGYIFNVPMPLEINFGLGATMTSHQCTETYTSTSPAMPDFIQTGTYNRNDSKIQPQLLLSIRAGLGWGRK